MEGMHADGKRHAHTTQLSSKYLDAPVVCQNVKQPKLPGEENFEALPMRPEDDEQKGKCAAMMQSRTRARARGVP